MRGRILAALRGRSADRPGDRRRPSARPTNEVVFWVMGMRRYGWLAEIKGRDGDGYFQYERRDGWHDRGTPADLPHPSISGSTPSSSATARPTSAPASAAGPARRAARCRRRLHVPAADHPLRPGRDEGRPALEQGALDAATSAASAPRPARPRPTRASSWRRPAATRSPATTRPGSPGRCTRRPIVATAFAVAPRRLLRRCSCTRRTARRTGESLAHLRVHPESTDPRHRDRRDDPRRPRRARRASSAWPAGIGRREGVGWRDVLGSRAALARTAGRAWDAIGRESLGQVRFREECADEDGGRPSPGIGGAGSSTP